MNIPPELLDVIECIKHNDNRIWEKVAAFEGRAFEIKFCCNSQRLQRVLLGQINWRARKVHSRMPQAAPKTQMPNELKEIVDLCENDTALAFRVKVWSSGKFDIIFVCAGGGLDEEPLLKDVP